MNNRVLDATVCSTERAEPSAAELIDFGRLTNVRGGGVPLDIFLRFGMSTTDYFTALRRILDQNPPDYVDDATVASMVGMCRRRLWLCT